MSTPSTETVEWRAEPGRIDYRTALESMTARNHAIAEGAAGELVWLLEHPALYTAGTSAQAGDLHPTGPLWGVGRLESEGEVAERETSIATGHAELSDGLVQAGARHDRRPLRLRLGEASWEREEEAVRLSFTLPRGAFATSVLRELFRHPTLI